jgi:hypothetical protein
LLNEEEAALEATEAAERGALKFGVDEREALEDERLFGSDYVAG